MDLEIRVTNLEKTLDNIIKILNNNKFYTDADISGIRQNVGDIQKEIYPEWIPQSHHYFAGERVSFEGLYYRCIQEHNSQPDWAPVISSSLWSEISDPAIEWPEWKQPAGAHDAYNKGDKVSHNDKHWTSDIDANVYEPGVYGWTEA